MLIDLGTEQVSHGVLGGRLIRIIVVLDAHVILVLLPGDEIIAVGICEHLRSSIL